MIQSYRIFELAKITVKSAKGCQYISVKCYAATKCLKLYKKLLIVRILFWNVI